MGLVDALAPEVPNNADGGDVETAEKNNMEDDFAKELNDMRTKKANTLFKKLQMGIGCRKYIISRKYLNPSASL